LTNNHPKKEELDKIIKSEKNPDLNQSHLIEELKKKYSNSHIPYNLEGLINHKNGHFNDAIQNFNRAKEKLVNEDNNNKDLSILYQNIGVSYNKLSQTENAITSLIQSIDLNNNNLISLNLFTQIFLEKNINFSKNLKKFLCNLMKLQYIEVDPISAKIQNFLAENFVLNEFLPGLTISKNNGGLKTIEVNFEDNFEFELLISVLTEGLIINHFLEENMSKYRSLIMRKVLEEDTAFLSNKYIISILLSLSRQSKINEFCWNYSSEEKEIIKKIENNILKNNYNNTELLFFAIKAISTYKNIYIDKKITSWLNKNKKNLPKIINEEYTYIKKENEKFLAYSKLFLSKNNNDQVTNKVRRQYEENPYPVWTKMQLHSKKLDVKSYLNNQLNWFDNNVDEIKKPNILIAGCGTGRHAIQTANIVKESSVKAIDISSTSLAYAQIMTERFGIQNIKFKNQSILELKNNSYDIIESHGVIHHMEDSEKALEVLANNLKKGGLLSLAIYNKMGRKEINFIRSFIKKNEIEPSDKNIVWIREHIKNSTPEKIRKRLILSKDFYSVSGCRDLFFNVQETQFNIRQIKQLIGKNNLRFMGFTGLSKTHITNFKKLYSDTNLFDLDCWDDFQKNNKDFFGSMYQFWTQKFN